MGLFSKKPDYEGGAWLTYYDGPNGDASRCFMEYMGHEPLRGHIPAATLEGVVVFHVSRGVEPPIDRLLATGFGASPEDEAPPPIAPERPIEWLPARRSEDDDLWSVGLTIASYPKKRALPCNIQIFNGSTPAPAEPVVQCEIVAQAWCDYTQWVLEAAGEAAIMIKQELVVVYQKFQDAHGDAVPGRFAYEAAEQVKGQFDAALRAGGYA
jgi:hypothetical protein